ncbi:hypothetical protein A7U35_06590 [Staphylococcus epidermidis]|uniref:Uncharacterized protein n=2 Tax=Staphylococcus TaxID=1279 RepID=A0A1V0CTC2_STAEP|nr:MULTISPECIES: hypothetical protein [Staphylococcus]ARA73628.1 hypothetical protein [Staphylococcus epidermidis]KZG49403.1 hypothetical protein A4U44_00295 [Staphylococcus epidermidis]KZG55062.1 hypothetical protein A0W31_03960 [Staphylococcus epidermidis]KZG55359.1 hypothetical protein A0W30_06195 [Staphylococcus epidermidis]KZG55971.1 hypothetical protein A4R96_06020 [Staphylococcus epidermidis]
MKEILRDILDYLEPYKKRILFVVACVLTFGIVMLLPPSPLRAVLSLLIVFVFVVEGYKWIGQPDLWGSKIGKAMMGKLSKDEKEERENSTEEVTVIKLFTNDEEDILEEIENNPELLDDLDTIQYRTVIDYELDIENQIIPEGSDKFQYEYHIIYDGEEFYHIASYEMSGSYEAH